MEHELAGSCACGSDTETVHYIVETAFKELEKDLTGDTFSA